MSTQLTRKRFTVDDCLRMEKVGILSPTERVELIRGEILVMSPIGPPHAAAVAEATRAMVRLAGETAIVWAQNPVVLDPFAAPQPDLALLRPRDDFYAGKHPGPADILLIVEIADSSLEYDTNVKLGLYAILGIPEYWVADLENKRLLVYSNPSGDTYQTVIELHHGDTVAPQLLPVCRISVNILLRS